MSEIIVKDADLSSLKGKVVIVTGGSSGIGLATIELLLSLGASVVSADINPPPTPVSSSSFLFVQTNVAIWSSLAALFKAAVEKFSHIDYVFANAGIGPRGNYIALDTDENGDLKEPVHEVLEVNFKSVVNTTCLAIHYLKQNAQGGNIVLMGSSTGLQPLRAPDYSAAKAGVLGFGRSIQRTIKAAKLPIRVNTLAPSWTSTQVMPNLDGIMAAISHKAQSCDVVARSAAFLMTTTDREGDILYVSNGRITEIEQSILAPAYATIKGDGPTDDEILERILGLGA
ncbi:uncharacterized protein EAF01_006797 [Botrytis porri]|uniref:uncharacterized protein n=1 Tax=Botrytis porri TaxID=87229 RepID=UPI0019004CE9|nr:uncharacterized protein EAF01_006797 [Botrytis porri]KAF7903748.1 hypothetical protein EAF01_006797 [Botrytis porri]